MNPLKNILLAEDTPKDAELVIEGFAEHHLANAIEVAKDGIEALDYLHSRGRFDGRPGGNPVLILLDLKMPRMDGLEVLRQLKAEPKFNRIPVVVMTSSHEEQDIIRSQELGVVAYVLKPVRFAPFLDSVAQLGVQCALTNATDELESNVLPQ
jgi:CheY-like chemotaxis protein